MCLFVGTDYEADAHCPGFLRHKNMIGTPQWFMEHGITVHRIVQHPGEYVIVKPGVIHWGFNSGANVAEAINFALSTHDAEVVPIAGKYELTECNSGLYNGSALLEVASDDEDYDDEEFVLLDEYCDTGYRTGIAQIFASDMAELKTHRNAPKRNVFGGHRKSKSKKLS